MSQTYRTITIDRMPSLIQHVVIGLDQPAYFHGEPGCGKTEGLAQACEDLDVDLIDFRAGQFDSVDFRGLPIANREARMTEWLMNGLLPFEGNAKFDPDRKKLVFADEMNAALLPVQGVLYQLFQERRIGEFKLQPNTYLCAAGNRDGDRGATNRLATPLANRFIHYGVAPDAKAWSHWASGHGMPSELIAFLLFRTELISTFDPSKPDKAFATPRTWEKVGRIYHTPLGEEDKMASIQGAVGEGPAVEFWGFVDVIKDMPSIAEIEKNPNKVEVSERPEIRYAVAAGIAGSMSQKSARPFDTYLRRMDPEFGIMAWQLALKRDRTLSATPEFIDYSKTYRAVFAR
jgi:hypothetical protein